MGEYYQLADPPKGMVRNPDHVTSRMAAVKVQRVTLRQMVLDRAREAGLYGITDDELKAEFPDRPESSLRKRRTELAQENRLVKTAFTRTNRFGQQEHVWLHRMHHHNPPPIVEREQHESKDAQIERLKALLDAHNIEY